jgi:hypothetical protein
VTSSAYCNFLYGNFLATTLNIFLTWYLDMYTVQCTLKSYDLSENWRDENDAFKTGPDSRRLLTKILSKLKDLLLFRTLCSLQTESPTDEFCIFMTDPHTMHVQNCKTKIWPEVRGV